MKRIRVLVLGGTGMLGSMVARVLAEDNRFEVIATIRSMAIEDIMRKRFPSIRWESPCQMPESFSRLLWSSEIDWVVNCVGMTKPTIQEDDINSIEDAVFTNSVLPLQIAEEAAYLDVKVIQIATDCVFSGHDGGYTEDSLHDAVDIYGKTKSLGEAQASGFCHLRCSIIGPEVNRSRYLLEWFRSQPENATIPGYTNHLWNGITTLHFAELCVPIMLGKVKAPSMQHVVPGNSVSKHRLLQLLQKHFRREDITIEPTEAPQHIDRVLATKDTGLNMRLWQAAGYPSPPTIEQMIEELADYESLSQKNAASVGSV